MREEAIKTSEKWRSKIEMALFGEDGRHGIVKDIGDIKHHVENNKTICRDWRTVAMTVGSGIIIAMVTWGLAHL